MHMKSQNRLIITTMLELTSILPQDNIKSNTLRFLQQSDERVGLNSLKNSGAPCQG